MIGSTGWRPDSFAPLPLAGISQYLNSAKTIWHLPAVPFLRHLRSTRRVIPVHERQIFPVLLATELRFKNRLDMRDRHAESATNFGVALMLYRFRRGDANMRSVWICSRNDPIGNIAVVAAAAGVFGTGTAWPDLVVAVMLASLGLWGGGQIIAHALRELKAERLAPAGSEAEHAFH